MRAERHASDTKQLRHPRGTLAAGTPTACGSDQQAAMRAKQRDGCSSGRQRTRRGDRSGRGEKQAMLGRADAAGRRLGGLGALLNHHRGGGRGARTVAAWGGGFGRSARARASAAALGRHVLHRCRRPERRRTGAGNGKHHDEQAAKHLGGESRCRSAKRKWLFRKRSFDAGFGGTRRMLIQEAKHIPESQRLTCGRRIFPG